MEHLWTENCTYLSIVDIVPFWPYMDFGAASALHQAWPSFTSPLLSPSQEAIAIIIPTAKFHTHHFWWTLSEIILIFRDKRPSFAHLLTLLFVWAAFCNPGLNLRLTILLLVTLRVASWWTLFQVFLYFCCDAISAVLVLCLCCVVLVLLDVFVLCKLWLWLCCAQQLWSSFKIQSRPYCCDAGLLFILGNLVCNCNLR